MVIRQQKYEYERIAGTPYTLGISVPRSLYKFHGEIEAYMASKNMDLTEYFDQDGERNWQLNPDWTYCEIFRGEKMKFDTPEDLLLHFLRLIRSSPNSWAWKNTGVGIKLRHGDKNKHFDGMIYSCKYWGDMILTTYHVLSKYGKLKDS